MRSLSVFIKQTWILTFEELRELLSRKRSLITLILYLVIVFLFLQLLVKMEEGVFPKLGMLSLQSPGNVALVSKLKSAGLNEALELAVKLSAWPKSFWLFQSFSIFWIPILISMVSCDMISIDIYRGTLRYVLTRTSREAYFVSKFLAHFLVFSFLHLFALVALTINAMITLDAFQFSNYLMPAIKYFLSFQPYLLVILSGTILISSFTRKPMNAFIRIQLFWSVFLFLLLIDPIFSPFYYKVTLGVFAPFEFHLIDSALYSGVWAALFVGIALLGFSRRDI